MLFDEGTPFMRSKSIFNDINETIPYCLPKLFGLILVSILAMGSKTMSFKFEGITLQSQLESHDLLLYATLARILSYSAVRFQGIYAKMFVSQVNQSAFRFILLEYLNLKFESIQKIGVSTIYNLIFRRSYAFSDFIEVLSSSFITKLVLLVLSFFQISSLFKPSEIFKMVSFMIFFSVVIGFLQHRRSYLRFYINSTSEFANIQRIDILTSYEKTISYGTLTSDIEEYCKRLRKHTYYKQLYNTSFNLIGLLLGIFLLYFSKFIWQIARVSNSVTDAKFICLILTTENLKDTFFKLMTDLDTFFMSFSNFEHSEFTLDDQEIKPDQSDYISEFKNKINVENLSIKIGNKTLIENVSFEIPKNKKIAIFGENGCGKSLLLKSMVGLIDYQGSITIDAIEVKEMSLSTISHILSYVSQNIRIFNRSVMANLRSGGTLKTDEEIFEKCKEFEFSEVFDTIGYSKIVGEKGQLISGGQRQRIILMRAILREKNILILDSAFTGIDQKTEENFIKKFSTSLKDKTVLCAVQDASLLSYFDEIIFFNNGKVEVGSVDKLIASSREFEKIFKSILINKETESKKKIIKPKKIWRVV